MLPAYWRMVCHVHVSSGPVGATVSLLKSRICIQCVRCCSFLTIVNVICVVAQSSGVIGIYLEATKLLPLVLEELGGNRLVYEVL